jgi:hypothetical protein
MRNSDLQHLCSIVLALALLPCIARGGEEAKAAPTATPRYGPLDVEMVLRDRSRLRVKLAQEQPVVLRTAYGNLNVPTTELRNIRRGDRLSSEEQQVFSQALKDLDSDDFSVRQAAHAKIVALGIPACGALKDALPGASTEARARIETVLKKVEEGCGRTSQPLDSVKTRLFEARGILDVKTFTVTARFGKFDIRFDDIDRIQWLAYGELGTIALDINKTATEWIDTGVDLEAGEEALTRCTGQVNIQGNQIGPEGSENWGRQGQFVVGSVIGRIGLSGREFSIGKGSKFTPDASGRLYAKIYIFPHMLTQGQMRNAKGQYDLVIATGPRIEEVAQMPETPAPGVTADQ